MSQTTEAGRFASMFVALTGRETLTQRQRDHDRRVEADAERDVVDYVDDTSREHGLGDAIDQADDALAE